MSAPPIAPNPEPSDSEYESESESESESDDEYVEPAFRLPKEACFMIFCGRPRSGKSYAIRSIIQQIQQSDNPFHFGVVFTTTKFNTDYDFLDQKYVRDKFELSHLQDYIKGMEDWREKNNGKLNSLNFVILDDLQGARDPNHPDMKAIVATYRHTNTTFIITAQYLNTGTSTGEREASVHTFLFNTGSKRSMTNWYSYFGQLCDNEEEFIKKLKEVTGRASDHRALLCISGRPTKHESYLAWKADPVDEDFKIVFPRDRPKKQPQ